MILMVAIYITLIGTGTRAYFNLVTRLIETCFLLVQELIFISNFNFFTNISLYIYC